MQIWWNTFIYISDFLVAAETVNTQATLQSESKVVLKSQSIELCFGCYLFYNLCTTSQNTKRKRKQTVDNKQWLQGTNQTKGSQEILKKNIITFWRLKIERLENNAYVWIGNCVQWNTARSSMKCMSTLKNTSFFPWGMLLLSTWFYFNIMQMIRQT